MLKKAAFTGVVTPPQVAANLCRHADEALAGAAAISKLKAPTANAKELRLTLGDIEAFAHLGRYYAAKIEAACELALFDANCKPEHQQTAIRKLEEALGHWRAYAAAYAKQYQQPLLYNRVGWVDIPALGEKVAADIELARAWKPGSLKSDPGGAKKKGNVFGQ
jgi:hypothetical protein